MKICLIIVDAWKTCFEQDIKSHPLFQQQCDTFYSWLNVECQYMKKSYDIDIYHDASGHEISNFISLYDGTEIKNNYDIYFFCGTHLYSCIHEKYRQFTEQSSSDAGIVLNLSLTHPSYGSYSVHTKKVPYYYYNYKDGFVPIDFRYIENYAVR